MTKQPFPMMRHWVVVKITDGTVRWLSRDGQWTGYAERSRIFDGKPSALEHATSLGSNCRVVHLDLPR